MSFILDALKKSENERQQQASAEFSSVPTSSGGQPRARWLWVLGLLLAVNAAVVGGLLLREEAPRVTAAGIPGADETVTGAPAPVVRETAAAAAESDDFRERVARARESLPPRPVAVEQAAATEPVTREVPAERQARPPARSTSAQAIVLPSLAELRAEGRLRLPELHIDLHVYSEIPARRFVSINAQKLRENETLEEGPRVREITQDGVVLVHEGTAFIVRK